MARLFTILLSLKISNLFHFILYAMRHGVLRNDNDRGLGSTVVGSDGRILDGVPANDGRGRLVDVVADMLDSGGDG